MFRRLFTLLSALSLLLCVAVTVLLARDFRVRDLYKPTASVQIGRGRFRIVGVQDVAHDTDVYRVIWPRSRYPLRHPQREPAELIRPWHEDHESRLPSALGGFAYVRYSPTNSDYARSGLAYDLPTVESRGAVVPLWAVLGPTLPLPVLWVALWVARHLRGRRLASRGFCPSCRYDLRATPGRCPECGTPAPSAR